MKAAAAIIIILAVVVGVAPQFMDCQSQGKTIELPNGNSLPMKCHWTARAEIALAVPLLLCGLFMFVCRQKESRRQQAGLGAALGLFVVLLPTILIGVCAPTDMACRALMKPTLILAGILAVVLSGVWFLLAGRQQE